MAAWLPLKMLELSVCMADLKNRSVDMYVSAIFTQRVESMLMRLPEKIA